MNDRQAQIEGMLYTHKIAMLSKVLWKNAESDWQRWLKKSGIAMNEHLILLTLYAFDRATISDISKYGVMHVSTAYNFAKRLEQQALLNMEKDHNDKRNTYITLTDKGKALVDEIFEQYDETQNKIYNASKDFQTEMFHLPSFSDVHYLVAKLHGKDFINDVNLCQSHIRENLLDEQ
ncbi:HTH-type transcriptional regulator Hpr [Staphylococcus pseudintermedius]|uniref:HTH-type transcriptional regulator Hpr n=1 Tax=Staphylococcus pseudintermedius TaxID=283734 RepID=UPI001035ED1C|nr:HTH-type transcriptional regulator Hpr [Staphylococcus pseudintermedius]EGQ0298630.1 HTH-type transcriptional regulator Hpr [Staphylococcus pseudintermedius]EGQ1279009.1 HTH-type transcriptional regulator Hpr [Staphylococcus pseudintermedius]EGQ1289905.1 HTH-type transcriptional regulator Hpr [Staphylococcus pseudintermedius]EGQ1592967.1 HTH-type transcriptional regulator Hpr [Staphylococcus pseudintermedius]EGQ1595230.1 HTH-type transcriptional regulator Hpr [Staphylococcus pseudintermediu